MNKLRNIFKHLLVGLVVLTTVGMFAQPDKFNRANLLLRERNADLAVTTIDSVVLHPETMNNPASWTLRAFIYFELYKHTDKLKLYSPLRDTIVSSLKKSMSLKPDEDDAGNNTKLMLNLGKGYFNLAKTFLQDSLDYERSEYAYNKFKELSRLADTNATFADKDLEFYLAVGSVFSEIFIKDNKNIKAQNIAKVALLKVLELQPDNPSANINLGLMYYNQAVNLTKEMDYGTDLSQIDFIQENIVKLARQSLQFVEKVYNNDNKNTKAIEALYYIYRMLNENAKSDDFKKIGEQYGIKFNIEQPSDGSATPNSNQVNDKKAVEQKEKEEHLKNEQKPKNEEVKEGGEKPKDEATKDEEKKEKKEKKKKKSKDEEPSTGESSKTDEKTNDVNPK